MSSQKTKPRNSYPVVDGGMEVVAAQLGVPLGLVKAVKKSGSKAFLTHSRIDTGLLIPDLFAFLRKSENEIPDGMASPQDWLATEKAKREAIKRKQDERSVMPTSDAQTQSASAMALVFAELERRDRELPPALAGLDSVAIFKRMKSDTESIRRNLKKKFEEIGE